VYFFCFYFFYIYFQSDVYFLTSGASSPEWVKPTAEGGGLSLLVVFLLYFLFFFFLSQDVKLLFLVCEHVFCPHSLHG
jgi:hypothetical protein